MVTRRDDPAFKVRGRPPVLDKKGNGGSDESDVALNGQLPPGQYIDNQMESEDVKRIAKLKKRPASSIISSAKD